MDSVAEKQVAGTNYLISMLDAIRGFFTARLHQPAEAGVAPDPDRLRLATCALLLELAWADGTFGDEERAQLRQSLTKRMGLDELTADELVAMAEAERRAAHDYFQFTSLVAAHFSAPEKHALMEMMWELVAADGTISRAEDHLLRRVGPLLGLDSRSVADAKLRVQQGKTDT